MNSTDPHHQAHPSDSIPDAAYPDSSYRPSDGPHEFSPMNTSTASLPHSIQSPPQQQHPTYLQPHQQPYQHQYSNSQTSFTGNTSTYPATPASPNPNQVANSPWQSEPAGPPPPYDPSQAPSFYSPLSAPAAAHTSSSNLQIHTGPPGSSSGSFAPPSPYSMQSSQFPSSPEPGYVKYGPIAEARRRRKRKMKICIITMCFLFLFFIAMTIGIALGVLKVQFKDRDNDDPYA